MHKDVLYWVLMLIYAAFLGWFGYTNWPLEGTNVVVCLGGFMNLTVLTLLGWRIFGPPIK